MTIKPMASDPVLQKQLLTLYTTSQLSRGVNESIEDYNKRMEQYRTELAEKIKEQNSEILQKQIQGIKEPVSNDMLSLKNANSQIDSLKFWQFVLDRYDNSLDGQIAKLKQQQNLIQKKIDELKKGKEDGENLNLWEQNSFEFPSAEKKAAGMFDNDVLATGKRNILG